MSDTPDNLVLVILRSLDGKVDAIRDDIREIKGRLGILAAQYANISNRVDRMDVRVERIETRLMLNEPLTH